MLSSRPARKPVAVHGGAGSDAEDIGESMCVNGPRDTSSAFRVKSWYSVLSHGPDGCCVTLEPQTFAVRDDKVTTPVASVTEFESDL